MIQRPTMTSERKRAREMRENGATYRAIGEALGRNQTWARRQTGGIKGTRSHNPPASQETKETALRLRRRGVPIREIADTFQVRYDTVRAWCVGVKPYPGMSKREKVLTARNNGMSNKQIAEIFGYSSANVVAVVISQEMRRQKGGVAR